MQNSVQKIDNLLRVVYLDKCWVLDFYDKLLYNYTALTFETEQEGRV